MRGRAAVLAAAFSLSTIVSAQQPQESGAAPINGADLELLQSVRAVGERIASIVRLPVRADLLALRADEAVRASEARARAGRLLSPAAAAARGRGWRELGLGAGTDPFDLVVALALDLDGMTFDAARERLLVDATRLPSDAAGTAPDLDEEATLILATGVAPDEPVAGHYVAHLLMDDAPAQPAQEATTDALLARAALSEGGANLAALILLFGGVGLEAEVVSGKLAPDDALGGRLVPSGLRAASPVVSKFMEFVYLDGFAQAASLTKAGDFRRLMIERKRRRSTRDVLHLDRPPGERPDVAVPQPPSSLGLVSVDRDVLGEMGIVVLVSLLTGKDNLGLIAGDGWLGDSLVRFEPAGGGTPGDDGLTVWVSRWASAEDAKDFAYALERTLQSRFPGEAILDAAGGRVLHRADRVYRLDARDTEVVFQVATPRIDGVLRPAAKKKVPERRSPAKKK